MTIDDVKKIADDIKAQRYDPRHYTTEFAAQQACMVLADALRAAEGQVAYLNAKLDATHTNRCFNCEQTVTEATTSRQAAAVVQMREDAGREGIQAAFDAVHRISALPYTDSPRSAFDAARIMREACEDAIAALLSPAPAVAPVAQKPVAFDAEAALVAMKSHLFVKNSSVHPTPEADRVLFYALEIGIAAGRGGGR